MFEGVGTVLDFFIKRQETGACFGFVEMGSIEEAETAINKLSGKRVGGRMMRVNFAKPKPPRTGGRDNNSDRPSGGFKGPR
jgi:nucleolin